MPELHRFDLSAIQQEIAEAINALLSDRDLTCAGCGGKVWLPPDITVSAQVQVVRSAQGLAVTPTGGFSPLAVLCCDQCGQTVTYNLMKLGLWAKWASALLVAPHVNGHLDLDQLLQSPGAPGRN